MNAAFEFSLDKIVIQNAPCCNDLEFVYDTASRVFIGRDNLKTHHVAITVNTAGKVNTEWTRGQLPIFWQNS